MNPIFTYSFETTPENFWNYLTHRQDDFRDRFLWNKTDKGEEYISIWIGPVDPKQMTVWLYPVEGGGRRLWGFAWLEIYETRKGWLEVLGKSTDFSIPHAQGVITADQKDKLQRKLSEHIEKLGATLDRKFGGYWTHEPIFDVPLRMKLDPGELLAVLRDFNDDFLPSMEGLVSVEFDKVSNEKAVYITKGTLINRETKERENAPMFGEIEATALNVRGICHLPQQYAWAHNYFVELGRHLQRYGGANGGQPAPAVGNGGDGLPKKPGVKREEVSEEDYRAAWCQYKYDCDKAGIRFLHADLAKAIGLQEGSARNYYNDVWKPKNTPS